MYQRFCFEQLYFHVIYNVFFMNYLYPFVTKDISFSSHTCYHLTIKAVQVRK